MASKSEQESQAKELTLPELGKAKNVAFSGEKPQETMRKDFPWKEIFTEKVEERSLALQQKEVQKRNLQKTREEKMKKKVPIDALTKEWFNDENVTLDTRAYLLDKLLPTLVPGVEKLLMEVEKRKVLETDKIPPRFNSVNFLGEYLMRHNPEFHKVSEVSGYQRGMKEAMEEMKTQVPDTPLNKIALMKEEVRKKRKWRDQVDEIKSKVKEKRKEALAVQFQEWILDVNGKIPLAIVQNALRSFLDTPVGNEAGSYAMALEIVDTLEQRLNEEEFLECVHSHIKDLSSDQFRELLKHFCQCTNDFRNVIRHDMWRQMFSDLFQACDTGKIGILDRQRTLSLLENFYDSSPAKARNRFRDPRKWPVVELEEIEPAELWEDSEDEDSLSEEARGEFSVSQIQVALPAGQSDVALEDLQGSGAEQGRSDQKSSGNSEASLTSITGDGQQEEVSLEEVTTPIKMSSSEKLSEPTGHLGSSLLGSETGSMASQGKSKPAAEQSQADPVEGRMEFQRTSCEGEEGPGGEEAAGEDATELEDASTGEVVLGEEDVPRGEDTPGEEDAFGGEDDLGEEDDPGEEDAPGGKDSPGEEDSTGGVDAPGGEAEQGNQRMSPDPHQEVSMLQQEDETTGSSPGRISAANSFEGQAHTAKSFEATPQLIDEDLWSGNLLTSDLSLKYINYGDHTQDALPFDDPRFSDLRLLMADIQAWGETRLRSPFSEKSLKLPQFVQLLEMFVGEETSLATIKKLTEFFKAGYVETEDEKIEQLEKAHHEAFLARRKLLLRALFDKWDNESSGFLDLREVDAVLATFKEGMEKAALKKAKLHILLPKPHPGQEIRLSQKLFQNYIEMIVAELPGNEDEVMDNMVEFLSASLERSHREQLRGSARRKWLHQVRHAAETSGMNLEPVYKEIFKALAQDADIHGNKKISAHIALLEQNLLLPERGDVLLRNVACTLDDAPFVLNKVLYRDMKGISFAVVDQGTPIHVPEVHYHGNVHFWHDSHPEEEQNGSLLVVPLQDSHRRAFGVLAVDTLRTHYQAQSIFQTHEISFYQGVSRAFSITYHHVHAREHILHVVVTATDWLRNRAPSIKSITTYLTEPTLGEISDYILRKIMMTDPTGQTEIHTSHAVLCRKENFFRDYLFKCGDSSEVIVTLAFGEHHIAFPLRETSGRALWVFDINTGHSSLLPSKELRELQKMLKIVQAACYEILKEFSGETDKSYVLEIERAGEVKRAGILFYRFMLLELQACIQKLDPQASAQLKDYKTPPRRMHNILRGVLLLLHPEWAESEELKSWDQCRQKVNGDLIRMVCSFDPTDSSVQVQPDLIAKYVQGIHRRSVRRCGSILIEYLYNWTLTCLTLLELKKKL
ncbi:EF-hand calcium-binding domain-containing protein 5 isoform X1 [Ornithorhynchus anatinus]|uniref:EF-hand calcium-binding domain-containing protein 5 isoform X1 n=1 Tax=Ornithorhynchus anatinus TaxID=9258 RepID=UPI0010A7DEE2|nr:EF-hand calcium-binding domain-containing protein 5 isoform X1 [Ornithorhynchus anatinus]XP_007670751.2 EF-hand calcium-binding domain-containing protein 5 isoform X1 [Ornithorhynchus anatinus]